MSSHLHKSLVRLLIASVILQAPGTTQKPLLEKAYKKAHEAWLAKDYRKGIAWLKPLRSKLHERRGAEDLLAALHYSLGWKEYKARRPRQAKREFEQAAAIEPREKNVWYSLGLACRALGEERNAEKHFGKTIAIDPRHFDALLSLASLAYDAEQYPRARGYLDRAAKIHPRDPTLLLLQARCSQDQVLAQDIRGFTSTHFALRFGGDIPKSDRETRRILTYLERCHRDLTKILGRAPKQRIQVVLYSKREFSTLHGVADWMGAFYDGKVRIPYASWNKNKRKVKELMRHELAHAFVSEILPGASSWLQEGVAQWYQGRRSRESGKQFEKIAPSSAHDLRSPFARVQDPALVARLYLQSLILVEDLLDRKGSEALQQLLATTAKGSTQYAKREDKALEAIVGRKLEAWIEELAKKRSWARPGR